MRGNRSNSRHLRAWALSRILPPPSPTHPPAHSHIALRLNAKQLGNTSRQSCSEFAGKIEQRNTDTAIPNTEGQRSLHLSTLSTTVLVEAIQDAATMLYAIAASQKQKLTLGFCREGRLRRSRSSNKYANYGECCKLCVELKQHSKRVWFQVIQFNVSW